MTTPLLTDLVWEKVVFERLWSHFDREEAYVIKYTKSTPENGDYSNFRETPPQTAKHSVKIKFPILPSKLSSKLVFMFQTLGLLASVYVKPEIVCN